MATSDWTMIQVITLSESWAFIAIVIIVEIKHNRRAHYDICRIQRW